MNKAPNVKLSLRKLLIATLAVGPLAVLPSPVWAVLPTSTSFTATNGTATVSSAGTIANINASDKAVLVWANGQFNIAAGETYNFNLPSGGAVLNRVGYATTGALAATDTATINGTLLSNGKVFVLANGSIILGDGAVVNTAGGLVLSTLVETSNGTFVTLGDLTYTHELTTPPTTPGNITIGAVTVAGNLTAHAGGFGAAIGGAAASTVTGDLVLRAVNANTGIALTSAGALSVGGNLTVTTNNGAITQGAGAISVGNTTAGSQIAAFTTGNNTITLGVAANDFQVVTANTGNTTTTSGSVSLTDANIIRLGASNIGGGLTVNAAGNSTLDGTAIATTGKLVIAGDAVFNQTGAYDGTNNNRGEISIAHESSVGGALSGLVTTNGSFTFNGTGNLTVGSAGASIVSTNSSNGGNRSNINITTTGNLTVAGAMTALGNNATAGGSVSLRANNITQTGGVITTGNASRAGGVTFNATAGNVTAGNINSYNRVELRATGSISQATGTSIVTTNGTQTHVLNAGGNVTVANAGNAFAAGSTIQVTSGGTATVANTLATVLGTTNVTGNLNLTTTNANLVLGDGTGTAAQRITIGGVLNANVGTGTITDNDYSPMDIFGGMNLTAASVTLNAASALSSLSPRVTFGQFNANVGAGAVTVVETTSLNLGNVTAATLFANSTSGSVVDSGTLTLTTSGTFVVPSAGSVVLDGTTNSIPTLNVVGGSDNSVFLNSATILGNTTLVAGNLTLGTSTGSAVTISGPSVTGNLSVNSGGTISIAAPTTVTGNISLTSADTGATSISDTGTLAATGGYLTVSGTTSLSSSGGIVLDGANDFANVVLNNSTGTVTINDITNLTISGNTTGTLTATAGAITTYAPTAGFVSSVGSPWALTLGNLHVNSLMAFARAGSGDSGNSGTITQASGTSIHSETTTRFETTNANIIIGNNGNSFGRVEAHTNNDGARTVTIVEDGTLKLGLLNSRGGSSITSRFGSIIEDPDANVTVTNNGTLTLSAPNGSILIGNTTHATGSTGGNLTAVVASAPNGAIAVQSSANLTLGNITGLSLTVSSGNNISQNGRLNIFGTTNITATRNITLDNASNNFGRVFLNTTNAADGNISITEGGTMNLGGVTQAASATANFTATSVNGDIIDSGLGGLRPGGTNAALGTGVITFSASNGNIVLDDPTTDFNSSAGVVFNGKNVTFSPLSSLVLGAANTTSVAGNLTVTSATGSITNAGNLSVTGDAAFQTGNGNITLTQAGNRFGTVRFNAAGAVGSGQVRITQANDINIVTGSTATGLAEFVSGSYITITNRGGLVTLGSTGNFTATGTIVLPKLLQAAGTLTVNSPSTKDLSALSVTADLAGRSPINLGTGTYLPPQP